MACGDVTIRTGSRINHPAWAVSLSCRARWCSPLAHSHLREITANRQLPRVPLPMRHLQPWLAPVPATRCPVFPATARAYCRWVCLPGQLHHFSGERSSEPRNSLGPRTQRARSRRAIRLGGL